MKLRFDLRALGTAARTVRDTHKRKAKAEAYVSLADSISARYLLGPRAERAEARAQRLYAAAVRALQRAGFLESDDVPSDPERAAAAGLAAARGRLRTDLRQMMILALPWIAIVVLLAVVATRVQPLRGVLNPTNLAARKAWRTNGGSYGGSATEGRLPRSGTEDSYFFHTVEESQPWLEVDLGAEKRIQAFKVENRRDCCQERAVPLVAETSTDGETWTFVGRRRGMFSTWKASFPARQARYVRFRSERRTTLHLSQVKIY